MKLSDFHYDLPNELIARYPAKERCASRLLYLDGMTGEIQHHIFSDLIDFIQPNDLLVFNNTRVIPARLFGQKHSGGKIEILVERILDEHCCLVHMRSNRSPKPGTLLRLENTVDVEVIGRQGDLFELLFLSDESIIQIVERIGHMPLPPYIDRPDEIKDQERYQTVYSHHKGSVAAPTAGLHFDEPLLERLRQKGVDMAFLLLHVGAGTFQSVRTENIEDHEMHAEYIEVSDEICEKVKAAKARGGRVIAVGTTSVRSLETASRDGVIQPFHGDTNIYIYPGYQFQCVDAMVTNFHLPESSLIMLVSAFAGRENILKAYHDAIDNGYRFYSYGDAMFITRKTV